MSNNQFRLLCKWASRVSLVVALMMGLAGTFMVYFILDLRWMHWLAHFSPSGKIDNENPVNVLLNIPLYCRVLFGLTTGISCSLSVAFCWTLRRLLQVYATGHYFDSIVPRHYLWLFIYALLDWFVDHPLAALVVTFIENIAPSAAKLWPSSPGNNGGLTAISVAVLLFILSRIMAEGVRIQEEQNLTV